MTTAPASGSTRVVLTILAVLGVVVGIAMTFGFAYGRRLEGAAGLATIGVAYAIFALARRLGSATDSRR